MNIRNEGSDLKLNLALVIPWFGKNLKGGAEQLAYQVAVRLARRGLDVSVLTTCSGDFYSDWSVNHHKPGEYEEDGVRILRFQLKKRNTSRFDKINKHLLSLKEEELVPGISPLSPKDEKLYMEENIHSPEMMNFIQEHHKEFDAFLFIPYLFPSTLLGIPLIPERSIFQPCLHDECYAYLNCSAECFYKANRILFNAEGERETAYRIYGPSILSNSVLVGTGVEVDHDDFAVPCKKIVDGEYILYIGKKSVGKNTHFLIEAYNAYCRISKNPLKLVLVGNGTLQSAYPNSLVTDLGPVSEEDKRCLLKHCVALVNPSMRESYSRVIFEAWLAEKPIIVHNKCLATYVALKNSGYAGWAGDGLDSFVDIFKGVEDANPEQLALMGQKGCKYAEEISNWDKVIDKYIVEIAAIKSGFETNVRKRNKSIHQLLPNLNYGDAISNHALWIKRYLRSEGYTSNIYVKYIDPRVADECELFKPQHLKDSDGLIYHHSIGFEHTVDAVKHKGEKLLIYHNITPPEFFESYDDYTAELQREGRRDLGVLSGQFPNSMSDSSYNATELRERGFQNASVLPLVVDPSKWRFPPDDDILLQLNDGKKNILYVGRISPNKRQDHLVEMFYHLKQLEPNVRLCLVGYYDRCFSYVDELIALIEKYGLAGDIWLTGCVNEAELHAFYRSADLFVSMSEHEGFGVPLIEAMWFDIPVLAYKSTAVPETLGCAAFMFYQKDNFQTIASLCYILLMNNTLRSKILDAQRKRRADFQFDSIKQHYRRMIKIINGEFQR